MWEQFADFFIEQTRTTALRKWFITVRSVTHSAHVCTHAIKRRVSWFKLTAEEKGTHSQRLTLYTLNQVKDIMLNFWQCYLQQLLRYNTVQKFRIACHKSLIGYSWVAERTTLWFCGGPPPSRWLNVNKLNIYYLYTHPIYYTLLYCYTNFCRQLTKHVYNVFNCKNLAIVMIWSSHWPPGPLMYP